MNYALIRHLRLTSLLSQKIRCETTIANLTQEDFIFKPPLAQWSKVIREAEKIVGYPTSFMNLRWLLSDEFSNLAMHLRKVVGINHPIVKTAKNFLYNEHNNLQPWGLIILLLSKAVNPTGSPLETSILTQNQRILAELTEMIRTGHYVHRGMLNISKNVRDSDMDTAIFANKLAILIGDYLLATANGMLAKMRNHDLSYLISTALRDLSEGEFFGHRDSQNLPLPGKPIFKNSENLDISKDTVPLQVDDTLGLPIREWTVRTMFNGATLFGRGCQGALLLAGYSEIEQEIAYKFGCHLCLAWQASAELEKITSDSKESYSLVSAPVLFALSENPSLYEVITNVDDVDYAELKEKVLNTVAIEQTRLLYEDNARKASELACMFGNNQSIITIQKMIKTL